MGVANAMTRYGFRIRTRTGMRIDNLLIHGRDLAEAQRKLEQMYRHCEIIETRMLTTSRRTDAAANYEDALSLAAK
jgi:hypothetical protein